MVLELKEYTMASLGYKSSENPLNSAKQTRPPFFSLNIGLSLSILLLLRSTSPPFLFRPCDSRRRTAAAARLTTATAW